MMFLGFAAAYADEPDVVRGTLESLGYVTRDSAAEQKDEASDRPIVLLGSSPDARLRLESCFVKLHPEQSHAPSDPHVTCGAEFHWGRTEIANADAECPVRTHLIIQSDGDDETTAEAHFLLRFHEGARGWAGVSSGVQLPDPLKPARAIYVVIGADSNDGPWRLMAYHEFELPGWGAALPAQQVEFRRRLEDLGYLVRDIRGAGQQAGPDRPGPLVRPLPASQCRIETMSIEMHPAHSRAPLDPDLRFKATFRCGRGEIAAADVEIPLRVHLIIRSEDGLKMETFRSEPRLRIAEGQPAVASLTVAEKLPDGLKSGRAKLVVFGADSQGGPWRVIYYHEFVIRGLLEESPSARRNE